VVGFVSGPPVLDFAPFPDAFKLFGKIGVMLLVCVINIYNLFLCYIYMIFFIFLCDLILFLFVLGDRIGITSRL